METHRVTHTVPDAGGGEDSHEGIVHDAWEEVAGGVGRGTAHVGAGVRAVAPNLLLAIVPWAQAPLNSRLTNVPGDPLHQDLPEWATRTSGGIWLAGNQKPARPASLLQLPWTFTEVMRCFISVMSKGQWKTLGCDQQHSLSVVPG